MKDILELLKGVRRSGEGWSAQCPAHDDSHNSLSVHHRDGRWLLQCHAGCDWRAIINALGLKAADLFGDEGRGGGKPHPRYKGATVQPDLASSRRSGVSGLPANFSPAPLGQPGLTLDQYADAKALPTDFLRSCALSEITRDQSPALRIPYLGASGEELAVRYRIALEGDRFRWKLGAKPCLYGLNRLPQAQKAGHLALVEGKSDCHTLWLHEIPALGIAGATNWREERDAPHLDGIGTIYIVVEPDRGGDDLREWLSHSTIRHRAKLVTLPTKDASALHLEDPEEFLLRWQRACLSAVPWTVVEAKAIVERSFRGMEEMRRTARRAPSILERIRGRVVPHRGGRRATRRQAYLPCRHVACAEAASLD